MQATRTRPKIVVGAEGRGMVDHAGTRLLADVADATGLTSGFGDALAALRQRQSGHDPGRVAVDVAVMLADGGEAIADLAVLRDQSGLFGAVASDATAWRVLSGMDAAALTRLRQARADAQDLAWAKTVETLGFLPASTAAGMPVPEGALQQEGHHQSSDRPAAPARSQPNRVQSRWPRVVRGHPWLSGTAAMSEPQAAGECHGDRERQVAERRR